MSLIAECRLSSTRLPLVDTAAASPRTTIAVDRILLANPDRPALVCWVEAPSFETVEEALAEDDVGAYTVLEANPEQRLYHVRLETFALFPLKAAFDELGAVPDGGTTIERWGWEIRARFPDRDDLARFRDSCRDHDVSFRLERLYEPTARDRGLAGLTPKQRETLAIAHESGYFQIPRRATLGDLAEQLGISKPSVSARLRRAQRRVIKSAVEEDAS